MWLKNVCVGSKSLLCLTSTSTRFPLSLLELSWIRVRFWQHFEGSPSICYEFLGQWYTKKWKCMQIEKRYPFCTPCMCEYIMLAPQLTVPISPRFLQKQTQNTNNLHSPCFSRPGPIYTPKSLTPGPMYTPQSLSTLVKYQTIFVFS